MDSDRQEAQTVRTKSVDVGMLKGEINGVTIKVYSEFAEGSHTISFCLTTTAYGDPKIKQNGHKHPWGENLIHSVERYADDAKAVREEAWNELERRNLDGVGDWRD